jgi:hypothetical protein
MTSGAYTHFSTRPEHPACENTSEMTTRQLRRAAERQALKDARKQQPTRAEINRENAQHSTGPRTLEGKANSSQNAFQHGLYSKLLVIPGEDPAELDALKTDLRAEHDPVNTTEEILVNEMAEQFWRIRRFRDREARLFLVEEGPQAALAMLKFMPVIQRMMSAAERGFHKALTALRQLQKDRGFVPHSSENVGKTGQAEAISAGSGFVPPEVEAHWAEALKNGAVDPGDFELKELLAAEMDELRAQKSRAGFVSQNSPVSSEAAAK